MAEAAPPATVYVPHSVFTAAGDITTKLHATELRDGVEARAENERLRQLTIKREVRRHRGSRRTATMRDACWTSCNRSAEPHR